MSYRFQLGVFSVVYDAQNRILFNHRRDLDLWDLPGGGMNHGELPTDTAIRETKEETGFDIAIDRLIMIYAKPPPQDDDLIFIFSGHITGGAATTSDESDDVCFTRHPIRKVLYILFVYFFIFPLYFYPTTYSMAADF